MRLFLALLAAFLGAGSIVLVLTLGKRGRRSAALSRAYRAVESKTDRFTVS